MLKQLRRKFICITMILVLVMLTVIFCLVYSSTKAELEAESRSTLQRLSQIFTRPAGVMELPQDVRTPWFVMRVSGGMISAVGYTGYDLNDEIFLNEMLSAVLRKTADEGVLEKYNMMYLRTGSRYSGTIVFLDVSGHQASLRALVESCAIIGLISLAAFWLLSFFLARWVAKPVERAWDQQQQFVSDASHELKTPLTVIMSNAELLQEQPELSEASGRYAGNIRNMSRQMKGLVEGLLELTRADNGQVKKHFERLDMSALISQSLLEFEPVLFERGLTLDAQVESPVFVTGSNRYLKQLADILLDNACKYSDPGVVDIRFVKQGKSCLLTVANPGQPIAPEEQEKIFRRFYRSDEARTRTGSFGLGLSIAQSVVKEHRGKIWVQSNPTGNCFCVQLPCE